LRGGNLYKKLTAGLVGSNACGEGSPSFKMSGGNYRD